MYASGTGDPEGKHTYGADTELGHYSIAPIASEYGRFRGYGLAFTPNHEHYRPDRPLWYRVTKEGDIVPLNGWVPEFRSDRKSVV